MIKKVYAVLFAIVLALGLAFVTLGPAFALTNDDAEPIGQAQAVSEDPDVEVVTEYVTNKGEPVAAYKGDRLVKFLEGLSIFAGIAAPDGAVTILVLGAADPSDDTILVGAYDADGMYMGSKWFPVAMIMSVQDYVNTGS